MKKVLKRMMSVLLLLTIGFCVISSPSHVFAETGSEETLNSEGDAESTETESDISEDTSDNTIIEESQSSNTKDIYAMSTDELFEYIMSLSSDELDALYEQYADLDELMNNFSEEQQNQLAEKFENSKDNIETVATNTTWQGNWDYAIDGNYICLHEYNGSDTTYTIPASATISGTTYTTKIGVWTTGGGIKLHTGKIKKLSFEKGVIPNENLDSLFKSDTTIQEIDFTNLDTSNVTSMSYMFYGCSNLTSLDLSNFNTDNVKSMQFMFGGCKNLTSLDLSNFNTSSVTNMSYMFDYCSNLRELDVSHFNTSKVTTMTYMFSDCSNLTSLDVSNFKTNNVTRMNCMFSDCSNLTSLDVSNFKTDNVITMAAMFLNCSNLTSLDLSNFKTDNVTGMGRMFEGCKNLTSLDLSNFNTENVTYSFDLWSMFSNCSNLTSLSLFENKATSTTSVNYAWYKSSSNSCLESVLSDNVTSLVSSKLNKIKLKKGEIFGTSNYKTYANPTGDDYTGNWTAFSEDEHTHGSDLATDITYNDSSYVSLQASYTSVTDEEWAANPDGIWFVWEKSIPDSDWIKDWDYEITDNYIWLHKYNGSETTYEVPASATISGTTYTTKIGCWTTTYMAQLNTGTIKKLSFEKGVILNENLSRLFYNNTTIQEIDFTNIDTSNVTTMSYMFSGCKNLTSLDISNFKTDNVTITNYMFYNCSSLTSLNVSNFNTEKVTKMASMFYNCSSLTSLNVSNFNTEKVTDMSLMFTNCPNLTSLDISNFNTEKVTTMYSMFNGCSNLTSLDLSHFNTEKVTTMYSMFNGCSNLTSLDLSNFNTEKVTNMWNIFKGCSNLTSLSLFENKATSTTSSNYVWYNSYLENVLSDNVTSLVSSKLNKIKLKKGEIFASSDYKTYANPTGNDYTGNWTAFSEDDHTHGSALTADITYNGNSYVSLQASYASITDEEWAANPDGIWFVWEKAQTNFIVSNTVKGNVGSKAKEFSFTAFFPSSLYGKTLEATKSDGLTTSITVSDNGNVSFSLVSGESITFSTLTDEQINNTQIIEAAYTSEGYTTSSEVLTTDESVTISFTNTRNSAVPTGTHNNNAYLWLIGISALGLLLVIAMQKLRKD